jgi:hypothetical protein
MISIEFHRADLARLTHLISLEATGVCTPIGNSEILFATVYKSPGRAWSDADITELLSFRRKSILTGDLNTKHAFWNSDKRVTWRLHIEMIEAKAFRTFIRICSLFKIERLSTNIKLILHKALIRSIMTYVSPAWEFAANKYLLKLQRLQNKFLRTIGNFPRRTSVHDLHMAFKLPYIYDYITTSRNLTKQCKLKYSQHWTRRTATQYI